VILERVDKTELTGVLDRLTHVTEALVDALRADVLPVTSGAGSDRALPATLGVVRSAMREHHAG